MHRGDLIYAAWATACVAAFSWLFSMPGSDDYAGWLLVAGGFALPSHLALRSAPLGVSLTLARALAVAIPGVLAFTGPITLLAMLSMQLVVGDDAGLASLLTFTGTTIAAVAGGIALLVRTIRRAPHPGPTRRVLWAATALGMPGVVALPIAAAIEGDAFDRGLALAAAIAASLPFAWSAPLLATGVARSAARRP